MEHKIEWSINGLQNTLISLEPNVTKYLNLLQAEELDQRGRLNGSLKNINKLDYSCNGLNNKILLCSVEKLNAV
jgi:hypothetical protein